MTVPNRRWIFLPSFVQSITGLGLPGREQTIKQLFWENICSVYGNTLAGWTLEGDRGPGGLLLMPRPRHLLRLLKRGGLRR